MHDDVHRAIREAAAVLRGAERIGVIGHVGPDGDALGSSLALALAGRQAGLKALVSFPEPFVIPDQFRFLDLDPLVPPAQFPDDLDVVVACDTAAPDRIGELLAPARSAGALVVVDHHLSNGGFGDVVVIDPTAGSTAELAYHLVVTLEWELTPAVAAALYTGIVTDTGRFQYSATSPETHRIVAHLLESGVRPEVINRHLFEEAPFGYLAVAGVVLGRAVLEPEHDLVWSILERGDLDAAGVAYEDTDGLIDLIRIAREAEVALLLKRLDGDTVRGSLRSRGEVDVAEIAQAFGGGGHHNAAGFTAETGSVDAVMDAIRQRL